MNSDEVLSLYASVADITDQMLSAARAGDWDSVCTLETRCARHVATLKSGESPVALSGAARERKVAMIQKILADDREIRNIAQPWMANLSALMNSAGTEQKLSRAYRAY
ncbi:MAG: flagellar protein FliT [Oxalobacteraceae bacterium]|nr:flagellar protein FliT [Oxalobacteraceae bacterium]